MPTKGPPTKEPQPLTERSAALALLASSLWGGNLVALKYGYIIFPPFWSAWWRFLLGTVAVAVWARFQGASLNIKPAERKPLFFLSAIFTIQIVLMNTGAELTSPAYAVVILNAHPVFSNLLGHFVDSENRLTRARLLGLGLAFAGICYAVAGRPVEALAPSPVAGNLMLAASAFLLASRTIYTRRIVQSINPLRAVVWQGFGSLPVFLILAWALEPPLLGKLAWGPVLAIVYQGPVIAGFCFIIWTLLLRRHSAGTLAMFAFTVPFFGIGLSALVFGEPITAHILVAVGLVTAGIAIVTRSGKRA